MSRVTIDDVLDVYNEQFDTLAMKVLLLDRAAAEVITKMLYRQLLELLMRYPASARPPVTGHIIHLMRSGELGQGTLPDTIHISHNVNHKEASP